MPRVLSLAVAVALVGPTGLSASGQATPKPDHAARSFFPVLRPPVGEVSRYRFEMTMTTAMVNEKGENPLPGAGMDTKMNGVLRYRTIQRKPNGNVVQSMATEKMLATMMGNPLPIPKTPPVTTELNPRGLLVSAPQAAGAQSQAMAMMGGMSGGANMPGTSVVFPERPVRLGDTWEVESTLAAMNMKLKYRVTLVGVETYRGREALRLRQVVTSPLSMGIGPGGPTPPGDKAAQGGITGELTVSSTSLVSEKTGLVLKSSGDLQMTMKVDAPQAAASPLGSNMSINVKGKISMDLIGSAVSTTKPAVRR